MAATLRHLTTSASISAVLLLIFLEMELLCLVSSNPSTPALLLHSLPAMVLPLYHSTPNSSYRTSSSSNPRRLLGRSESLSRPNARMSLYDDLLRNGYYTTRLWIGTPPQKFALIVDTGSTVTYVPCSSCEQCGRHQDPKFDPEGSNTYQAVKCNIDCTCDNERVNCIYERQYAEMSSSSGVLGEDLISFGDQSELPPQRAVFGCENFETGDLYSQPADGIMGLGRGDLSVVDQLVDKSVISDSFSLCYGGMDIGGGAMVLGGFSAPSDMIFTRSNPVRSPYYNIDLKEMHVAGKRLPLDPSVFDRKHGTVLDSGTTYAYLPEAAFLAFKDAIMKELNSLKQIPGPDPNFNDICFSTAGSDVPHPSDTFPEVDMIFGNGEKLTLSPENYLFRHSKVRGAYCLGIFQNGKDPTTLLGGIVVRNTLVMYDRAHSKIGFWKTNCSELWERLNESASPLPMPPASDEKNSTTEAPTGAPPYVLPGEQEVGKITFGMSLNISYSDLKPHITELAEYIAQELEVNTSQVHLLKFTTNGNDSLVKWAIFPAASTDSISNTTALDIISKLSEHRLKFPVMFGTYELLRWHVEPKDKRSWWQRNYLVVLSILGILVIALAAVGFWFIWRHRQRTANPYKPVNVAVPEQELQPL
ncbi:aspartic proteinase nepenthesin-1-like [Pyrus ussuriensis x Pyrus communis]|uniref:Aspartic proteinase nepenthesin-1-like n=1 Tax=Pyrus ussuriensis x Pyrus communis TaxID=2448454 RepID=A0A5N5HI79_9ROSA|nr:aspartic proteinase nepenthesin-1-like [Pyrus ussuriensis x Pyrus communis]